MTTEALTQRLADLFVWGAQRSWELLNKPVNIYLTMDDLGFTHPPTRAGDPIEIYVNPSVLDEPRGEEYLRALILHELGHHLSHFSDPEFRQIHMKMRQTGLGSLFNLICDEHLERRLRSINSTWGEDLDALASYTFKGQPLELLIEQYQDLFADLPPSAIVDRLLARELPGTVVDWQRGYRLANGKILTFPEFIDHLFTAASATFEQPITGLNAAWDALREVAKQRRGSDDGVLPDVLAHPLIDASTKGLERMTRISVAELLSANTHSKEAYLDHVRDLVTRFEKELPRLRRYLDELEVSRDSEWFWNKQRSMLWNMERGHDFKWTFVLAEGVDQGSLREILTPAQQFARQVMTLIESWSPEVCTLPTQPHRIRLTWVEAMRTGQLAPEPAFAIALCLGAREFLPPQSPARNAMRAIPRRLKDKQVRDLAAITKTVAQALEQGADQPKPDEPPDSIDPFNVAALAQPGSHEQGDGGGTQTLSGTDADHQPGSETSSGSASGPTTNRRTSSLTDGIQQILTRQRQRLTVPTKLDDDDSRRDDLRNAGKQAVKRIEHWLRTGIDPAHPFSKPPAKSTRHSRPSQVQRIRQPPSGDFNATRSGTPDADLLNLAPTLGFDSIGLVTKLPPDPAAYEALRKLIQPQARRLRQYLSALGETEEELPGSRRGRRIDAPSLRRLMLSGDPAIFMGQEARPAPDLFLGVAIDCSGSMDAEDRFDKAKAFGVLLLEACRRLAGVQSRAIGFTDSRLYDLGSAGDTSIASLEPRGGNNDAAALLHLARLALASARVNRILVMISDGFPTECSLDALRHLVAHLHRQHRILCAQVAVESMDNERVAFPQFTDLTEHDLPSAIRHFGRLLQHLIASQTATTLTH